MLTFPDPSVSTEYIDPNGAVWEFNGTGWVRQCESSGDGNATIDINLDEYDFGSLTMQPTFYTENGLMYLAWNFGDVLNDPNGFSQDVHLEAGEWEFMLIGAGGYGGSGRWNYGSGGGGGAGESSCFGGGT